MADPITFVALGTPDPEGAEALARYAEAAVPMLVAAGGEPRFRARRVETLVGEDAPDTVFAVDFPDGDAVKGVLASDAYKALVPDRDAAFRKVTFLLAEQF
ncbi:MAG: DUF1330 domain-containing protein [Pseudomonadota bacterium]